jgi:hypothetical protein
MPYLPSGHKEFTTQYLFMTCRKWRIRRTILGVLYSRRTFGNSWALKIHSQKYLHPIKERIAVERLTFVMILIEVYAQSSWNIVVTSSCDSVTRIVSWTLAIFRERE